MEVTRMERCRMYSIEENVISVRMRSLNIKSKAKLSRCMRGLGEEEV
jgi:hypothetical protein